MNSYDYDFGYKPSLFGNLKLQTIYRELVKKFFVDLLPKI